MSTPQKPPEQVIEEAYKEGRRRGRNLQAGKTNEAEEILNSGEYCKQKAQELPQIKPKLDWYETEEMGWEARLPFGGRYFVDKDHTMWQLIDASAQTIVASGMGSIEEAEKDFEDRVLRLFGSGELPGPVSSPSELIVEVDGERKNFGEKPILDACCGGRMFWFDKEREDVLFMDNREEELSFDDGRRNVKVRPDIVGDFRDMPFPDNSFDLVVFDPPHSIRGGETSWMVKKYGILNRSTWQDDLRKGFEECFRVLKKGGFVNFKWNEDQIKLGDVLKLIEQKPLFGQRAGKSGKTIWVVFKKD